MCRKQSGPGLAFRCTQKLRKRLGVEYQEAPDPDRSLLGPWYINQLPDDFDDVGICVNERIRLAVLVDLPRGVQLDELAAGFRHHLGNLLLDLGLKGHVIQRIMDEYQGEVCVTRTQDRSVLGTMNEFASTACYALAEQSEVSPTFDFGAMLYQLNDSPIMPLGGTNPTMLLRELCGT